MSAAEALQRRMTHEAYLAFERSSSERHDFVDGQAVAMAGCTGRHDTIAGNLFAALHAALRGQPCQVFTSDMKVHIPATSGDRYPDISVACGPRYLDPVEDVLVNPCLIVEVLSDSTEASDRGRKFHEYRSIPGFSEYVLVSQHRALVEHYLRQEDGSWTLKILPAGDTLRLSRVSVQVRLDDLYERVLFADSAPEQGPQP